MKGRGTVFVGTDVFLRFLVRDVEKQYLRARSLFQKAERGDVRLETTELVVAEVLWTLRRDYGFSVSEARQVAEAILGTRNLRVRGRPLLLQAMELYEEGGPGLADSFTVAYLRGRGGGRLATFQAKRYGGAEGLEFYDE